MNKAMRPNRYVEVAQRAAVAFADHVVTQRLDAGLFRSWRCQRPGSWIYGFDVMTGNGALIVAGDVGTLVVEREPDMIAWARKAVRDLSYFVGKAPAELQTKEFSPDKAREWIATTYRDHRLEADETERKGLRAQAVALKNALENGDEHEFLSAVYESEWSDEFPDFRDYTHSCLMCVEVVKWLLARLPE